MLGRDWMDGEGLLLALGLRELEQEQSRGNGQHGVRAQAHRACTAERMLPGLGAGSKAPGTRTH